MKIDNVNTEFDNVNNNLNDYLMLGFNNSATAKSITLTKIDLRG